MTHPTDDELDEMEVRAKRTAAMAWILPTNTASFYMAAPKDWETLLSAATATGLSATCTLSQ